MSCDHLETTSALFDGELAPPDASRAEEHLAGCAECRALTADMLRLRGVLTAERDQPALGRTPPPAPALWTRRVALPLPLFVNLLLLLAIIGFALGHQSTTRDAGGEGAFGRLDGGQRAVIHVRPRPEAK